MNTDAYERIHKALKRDYIYSDLGAKMHYDQANFCALVNDRWTGCIGGFVCVAIGKEPTEIRDISFKSITGITKEFFGIDEYLVTDLLIYNDAGCTNKEAADVLRILYQTGVVNWNYAAVNDKISKLIEENGISIEDLENFLVRP